MVLHVVEQADELVVVGAVPGLTRQLIHVGGPAGGFDGRNGHGVDFAGAIFPFPWRWVHDVGFGEGADLGHDGFFLLEKHAAGFEVTDLGHHGALHDGTALVVFDVAHPAGFVEGNFLGKALFFEVPDGIVIGIGEEVLDGGGCFDVVLQVGHEVSAIAFNLLVGGDGAEDNFGELAGVERAVGNTPTNRQHS